MIKSITVKNKCAVEFVNGLTIEQFDCFKGNKLVVFASKSVVEYATTFVKMLTDKGFDTYTYLTSDGEDNKNLNKAVTFTQYLAINGIGRKDIIINIGGGTLCDLGAFVASIYMRGISFVNIPTTLLCAVDACMGGKTAIDVAGEKNLWGTFYQPTKIIIDFSLLEKLPKSRISEGMSEIVKYAVIDADFERFLLQSTNLNEDLQEIIFRCLNIKAKFVEIDEFDNAERKALNLGHTVAHALESYSKYKFDHSTALAYGLVLESKIALKQGFISQNRYNSIISLCEKYLQVPNIENTVTLIEFMKRDKKNKDGKIAFSLPAESAVKVEYFTEEQLKLIIEEIG